MAHTKSSSIGWIVSPPGPVKPTDAVRSGSASGRFVSSRKAKTPRFGPTPNSLETMTGKTDGWLPPEAPGRRRR
jgi:hypothetical protein